MSVSSRFILLSVVAGWLAGCAATPEPTPVDELPQFVDSSAPLVRLSSQGLRPNFVLNQDSTQGVMRRVRSTDHLEFAAVAQDPESGVHSVRLLGEIRVTCLAGDGRATRVLVEPIADENIAPRQPFPEDVEAPGRLVQTFALDVAGEKGKCLPGRFVDMKLELQAEAENGQGMTALSQPAQIRFFGPDRLTVGMFNVAGELDHFDSDYLRWGTLLGRSVDVLLLNGVPDRRRAELVATMAGMSHILLLQDDHSDLAILSREPLRNRRHQVVTPAGALPARLSTILGAEVMLENYPHQLITAHFGTLDAGDEYHGPEKSSPSRVMAAEAILEMLPELSEPAIVAGTLNAHSGFGPGQQSGQSTEVMEVLLGRFQDPYVTLKKAADTHCSEQRVQYVLANQSLVPVRYEACFSESAPSTYPFVRVTFAVP